MAMPYNLVVVRLVYDFGSRLGGGGQIYLPIDLYAGACQRGNSVVCLTLSYAHDLSLSLSSVGSCSMSVRPTA